MSDLNGRTAVVTGGESGIGLAISEALAARGATVYIGGILEEPGAEAVSRIRSSGGSAVFKRTDVRSAEDLETLIETATAASGQLDVMVNNAGVYDGFASALETPERLWDQVIDINLKGCFFGCKAALKRMVPKQYGRIINTSSIGGLVGSADGLSYTASKFGIIGITKQACTVYAKYGITINAICPGVIGTELRKNSQFVLGEDAPDMQRGVGINPDTALLRVPARRSGTTTEIAAVAAFLASEEAAYINGQAIAIDGGWTAT